MSLPVMVAPMAMHGLAHSDKEVSRFGPKLQQPVQGQHPAVSSCNCMCLMY
jgi:hypothetical protein